MGLSVSQGYFCGLIQEQNMQAGTVGWSKAMIEKNERYQVQVLLKRKDFFKPCCDTQLIGNSWPGMSKNMDVANGI